MIKESDIIEKLKSIEYPLEIITAKDKTKYSISYGEALSTLCLVDNWIRKNLDNLPNSYISDLTKKWIYAQDSNDNDQIMIIWNKIKIYFNE